MRPIAESVVPGRCQCCGQVRVAYWTPERMADALRAWVDEHGETPFSRDWRNGTPDHPPCSLILKVFGRWSTFIRAAGFKPRQAGAQPWRKDDIANAMLDHLMRSGNWPTSTEWARPVQGANRPAAATVYAHFGTWDAAKRFAGWDGERTGSYERPVCSECGTDLENTTLGCGACASRAHSKRKRARKAETAALTLAREATVSDERKVAA